MNKKQIIGIIAFLMILSSSSVFADRKPPINFYTDLSYTSGETEHIVNGADFVEGDATLDGNAVAINAGGSATFGFFLPYPSRSVTVVYTGSGDITVETEQDEYATVTLESGIEATHKIEFGKNLGKDLSPQYREWGNEVGVLQEYVEHGGEKMVTITAGSAITIHELKFEKEITMGLQSTKIPIFSSDPEIQKYETELMSTVLIHENAPVIVVNGATRYIDNDDISKKPYNIDGSIYIPVNTLAKALGYYGEVIHDKGYALMRSDNHEVVMMGSDIKVTRGLAEPCTLETPAFVYREGEILAAVRYFAELCGKTVDYKDKLVVIDDKYTTRDALTQYEFYNYAKAKFDAFMSESTSGNTYYVATNGSASNSGTSPKSPWNLETALQKAEAGDTVILEAGTYREVLAPQNSGSPNAPVTYKAAEGARVIISATEEVSATPTEDKTVDGHTIYKFDVTGIEDLGVGRNQIFIDEEMQIEARYPDGPAPAKGLSNAWPVRGDIFKSGSEPELDESGDPILDANNKIVYKNHNEVYSDTLLNQADNYWRGGTYVGTFGNSYAVLTGKIASSIKGNLIIDETEREERWWDNWSTRVDNSDQWNYGMIVGHMNALNLPGEWIREGNELYMILPEGKTADTVKVEAKARQVAIDLRGRNYINIEGIETFGGGVTMDDSEMCMLNGVNMKYISHYTLNSDSRSGYIDFPLDNMKKGAPQRGEVGVYVGGKNNIIVNSKIDHSASAGIYATGLYGYFENNIINDCGYMGSYASGILLDVVPWDEVTELRGGYGIYNNTVYNAGRSVISFARNSYTARNATTTAHSHSGLIFLGSDVAYNDFHDACLLAQDGGAVYSNGVIGGFDKKLTTFRNNYVYKTTTGEGRNPYNALLYWDGNANSFDSYNNLLFETGDVSTMMTSIASAAGNEAYDRLWNNQVLGAITLDDNKPVADALCNEYFSEDRPFFAGSDLDRIAPYMNNYNRFENGLYTMQYEAKDAVLSDGVTVSADDGYAIFTGNGQYIDFKNVDFGDGANEMVISYFCDSNWTYDDFEIIVYDGSDEISGKTFKATAPQQDAPTKDKVCTMRFMIDPISGIKNVRVKVTAYYSARIGGIGVYKRTKLEETDAFSLFAYPLEYSDRLDTGSSAFMMMSDAATGNPHQSIVSQIWNGNIIRYNDQTITDDSDYFIMAAGRSPQYKKQTVRVYVCDGTRECLPVSDVLAGRGLTLVADFKILKQHLSDMEPIKVPVKAGTIAAGTYDIYFVFGYDEDSVGNRGAHTSMQYFGFLKQGADTSAYSTQVRYQGGLYDKNISVENGTRPFKTELLTFTDLSRKKLLNTLPGTTAGYSDIDVLYATDKLSVGYYATDEYDGQTVTVRVVSTSGGNQVATGTFTTNVADGRFTGKEITLNNTVPAGNYKVYFDFGGSGDMTCQLGWFRFGL